MKLRKAWSKVAGRKSQVVGVFAALAAVTLLAGGCSNDAWSRLTQPSQQATTTPTTTAQDQAAQGSQVNVYVQQRPDREDDDAAWLDADTTALAEADGVSSGDVMVAKNRATFVLSGTSITINTGSTTPSVTGTATGSGTGTQAPNQSGTANADQQVKPATTGQFAPALPGGNVQATGGAATEGGTATNDAQATQTATAAMLEGVKENTSALRELMAILKPQTPDVSTNGTP